MATFCVWTYVLRRCYPPAYINFVSLPSGLKMAVFPCPKGPRGGQKLNKY